jgi:hypothetical protein
MNFSAGSVRSFCHAFATVITPLIIVAHDGAKQDQAHDDASDCTHSGMAL